MRRLMKKLHRGEKGLTLIELLIVVAILGIISGVVIPNLGAFIITGRLSAANTELENVKTAALAFYAEHGRWPSEEGESSDVLYPKWLAAEPNATYLFADAGWIRGVVEPDDWEDLEFVVNEGNPDSHGTWTRVRAGG